MTQQELNDGSISYTVSVAGLAVNDDVVDVSYTWTDHLLQENTISIGWDRRCQQSRAILRCPQNLTPERSLCSYVEKS